MNAPGQQADTASSWVRCLRTDEMAGVLAAARSSGLLGPADTAVVFHDLGLLEARLEELVGAFPASALHAVAVKANPLVEVLRVVVGRGCGLEAASIEEVHLALAAGCPPERIVYDSPAKTFADLHLALDLGVHVNADSLAELDRIIEVRPSGSRSVVGLRVNPLEGGGSIPTTAVAGPGSRFGVPVDDVVDGLVARAEPHPWIRGLHHHLGSQGVTLGAHAAAARTMAELGRTLHERLGRTQFDVVDLGGGLPADYGGDGQGAVAPSTYVAAVRAAAPDLFDPGVRLVTEFGRAIQANCGWAWSTVEYVKRVGDQAVAVVHLGADFLLRAAYRPEHWAHRLVVFPRGGSTPRPPDGSSWIVAGPLCFAGDVLGRDLDLGDLQAGDDLVIHDAGAYTLGLWSRHCSRTMPLVLGHRAAAGEPPRLQVLRSRETVTDVLHAWQ